MDAEIDFLTDNRFSDIYKYNINVNRIIKYNKFNKSLSEDVNNNYYDLIFDLQNNRKSKSLINNKSKLIFSCQKNYLHKLSLVYLKKSLFPDIKLIHEKYLDSANHFDLNDDNLGLEFWTKSDFEKKKYLPHNKAVSENDYIGIAPGAFHYTKRWQQEKFKVLADRIISELKKKVIIFGGKTDVDTGDFIKNGNQNIINIAGKTSLTQTAEELDKCKVLITNDTGVMHIAAARQIPVIAIFGSTVQEFGFIPFRVKNIIVEKNISCRPCTHIGRSKCPKKHFKCMNDISVHEVYNKLLKILNG